MVQRVFAASSHDAMGLWQVEWYEVKPMFYSRMNTLKTIFLALLWLLLEGIIIVAFYTGWGLSGTLEVPIECVSAKERRRKGKGYTGDSFRFFFEFVFLYEVRPSCIPFSSTRNRTWKINQLIDTYWVPLMSA